MAMDTIEGLRAQLDASLDVLRHIHGWYSSQVDTDVLTKEEGREHGTPHEDLSVLMSSTSDRVDRINTEVSQAIDAMLELDARLKMILSIRRR